MTTTATATATMTTTKAHAETAWAWFEESRTCAHGPAVGEGDREFSLSVAYAEPDDVMVILVSHEMQLSCGGPQVTHVDYRDATGRIRGWFQLVLDDDGQHLFNWSTDFPDE